MKNWIIYTRVSTDDQAQEGHSLAMQEAACRAMLTATGAQNVTVIRDDGFSAASLKRPGMAQILDDAKAGNIAGFCVWKLDRLSRNLRDLLSVVELFDTKNVALVSVTERIDTSGPMGKFTLSLLGALAQLERDQISHRTKSAMQHMKSQGIYTGGPIPPGLRVVDKRLEADPLRAPVVVEVFQIIADGGSLRMAGKRLHAAGFYDGEPKPMTVALLVRNARLIEHRVVSQELFDAVDAQLAGRWCVDRPDGKMTRGHRPSDFVWPLQGLCTCGRCGRALCGASAKGRKNKATGEARVYRYLRCAGRGSKKCNVPDLPADAWEGAVASLLAASIKDGSFATAYGDYALRIQRESAPLSDRRIVLRQERDSAAAKLDRILDQVEDGTLTGAAVKARVDALQAQVDRIGTEMAGIDGQMAAADLLGQGRAMMEATMLKAADRLATADATTLQGIFSGLIASAVLDGDKHQITINMHSPAPCGAGSYTLLEWGRTKDVQQSAGIVLKRGVSVRREGQGYSVRLAF